MTTTIQPSSRLRRTTADFVDAMVDDELVFMDVSRGWFYSLRETGLRIWELIGEDETGRISVDDIVSTLCEEYDVDRKTCLRDTEVLIEELLEAKLVEIDSAAP